MGNEKMYKRLRETLRSQLLRGAVLKQGYEEFKLDADTMRGYGQVCQMLGEILNDLKNLDRFERTEKSAVDALDKLYKSLKNVYGRENRKVREKVEQLEYDNTNLMVSSRRNHKIRKAMIKRMKWHIAENKALREENSMYRKLLEVRVESFKALVDLSGMIKDETSKGESWYTCKECGYETDDAQVRLGQCPACEEEYAKKLTIYRCDECDFTTDEPDNLHNTLSLPTCPRCGYPMRAYFEQDECSPECDASCCADCTDLKNEKVGFFKDDETKEKLLQDDAVFSKQQDEESAQVLREVLGDRKAEQHLEFMRKCKEEAEHADGCVREHKMAQDAEGNREKLDSKVEAKKLDGDNDAE